MSISRSLVIVSILIIASQTGSCSTPRQGDPSHRSPSSDLNGYPDRPADSSQEVKISELWIILSDISGGNEGGPSATSTYYFKFTLRAYITGERGYLKEVELNTEQEPHIRPIAIRDSEKKTKTEINRARENRSIKITPRQVSDYIEKYGKQSEHKEDFGIELSVSMWRKRTAWFDEQIGDSIKFDIVNSLRAGSPFFKQTPNSWAAQPVASSQSIEKDGVVRATFHLRAIDSVGATIFNTDKSGQN